MPGDEWRYRHYFHHTHYAGGKQWAAAHELHRRDPTLVLYKAIYKSVGNIGLKRHELIARLHLFADDVVHDYLKVNISDQIRQLRPVQKKLNQFTDEEIKNFPKIFDYPEDYAKK